MKIVAKNFDELTTKELYELLKARAEIFVVEQNCVYQDLDDKDYHALHVFFEEEGKVMAYLRVFPKEAGTVQMGRVLTRQHGTGLGGRLLKTGIEQIQKKMQAKQIYIEAQSYATGFYEREGFRIVSDEFLEDGIPHVKMVRNFRMLTEENDFHHMEIIERVNETITQLEENDLCQKKKKRESQALLQELVF